MEVRKLTLERREVDEPAEEQALCTLSADKSPSICRGTTNSQVHIEQFYSIFNIQTLYNYSNTAHRDTKGLMLHLHHIRYYFLCFIVAVQLTVRLKSHPSEAATSLQTSAVFLRIAFCVMSRWAREFPSNEKSGWKLGMRFCRETTTRSFSICAAVMVNEEQDAPMKKNGNLFSFHSNNLWNFTWFPSAFETFQLKSLNPQYE